MTDATVTDRVAAGVAWLDATQPGWADRIDLDRLKMSDCERCVLGQIYGDFFDVPFVVVDERDGPEVVMGFDTSAALGAAETEAEMATLEAEWRRIIRERVNKPDDLLVWISIERRGVETHRPDLLALITSCDRSTRTGLVLRESEAVDRFGSKRCPRCTWPVTEPDAANNVPPPSTPPSTPPPQPRPSPGPGRPTQPANPKR